VTEAIDILECRVLALRQMSGFRQAHLGKLPACWDYLIEQAVGLELEEVLRQFRLARLAARLGALDEAAYRERKGV
jgi:hypothetical protein